MMDLNSNGGVNGIVLTLEDWNKMVRHLEFAAVAIAAFALPGMMMAQRIDDLANHRPVAISVGAVCEVPVRPPGLAWPAIQEAVANLRP